jgi:hypothetical protein
MLYASIAAVSFDDESFSSTMEGSVDNDIEKAVRED